MSPQAGVRLLVGLLTLCIVLYATYLVLAMVPLPEPFRTILLLVVVLIVLGVLLNWSGLWPGGP